MEVLKVCLYSQIDYTILISALNTKKISHHLQIISNDSSWLKSQNSMPWKYIVNIYLRESIDILLKHPDFSFLYENDDIDMYVVSQFTYGRLANVEVDLITSCYLWNYQNDVETRRASMLSHFEMEKKQEKYDYVCFQIVEAPIKEKSEKIDFFFESHVSDPNGIDEIYSKPFIGSMRRHSEKFLDVNTRKLSFGRVIVNEF